MIRKPEAGDSQGGQQTDVDSEAEAALISEGQKKSFHGLRENGKIIVEKETSF